MAPVITMVAPLQGPAIGGTNVTIRGYGLGGVNSVSWGPWPAEFEVVSDLEIVAVSPRALITGVGAPDPTITVSQPDGQSASWPGWQYTPWSPIPSGRGRWKITLHRRQWADTDPQTTLIAEMLDARSRRLEQSLNKPAVATFTLDGRGDSAALLRDLQTDCWLWRWDERQARDVPYFRGIVGQTEDELTEQSYTINVTCHDYLAMLGRRYVTRTKNYAQIDQDSIALDLLTEAKSTVATPGTPNFAPGSYVPLTMFRYGPDGLTTRPPSGTLRDRTYEGSQEIGAALDNLANVQGGFDYDVIPGRRFTLAGAVDWSDQLRVFFPSQGIARPQTVLEYGTTLAGLTRTVNSSSYANFVRALGDSSDLPAGTQLYSERWNSDSNNVSQVPVGLWMTALSDSTDVKVQTTLDQHARGVLDMMGLLEPSYSLKLAPGVYYEGIFGMGDTVPLAIRVGRLNVEPDEFQRIVGLRFVIGDDAEEDVELTVGRPLTTLANMLAGAQTSIASLARR